MSVCPSVCICMTGKLKGRLEEPKRLDFFENPLQIFEHGLPPCVCFFLGYPRKQSKKLLGYPRYFLVYPRKYLGYQRKISKKKSAAKFRPYRGSTSVQLLLLLKHLSFDSLHPLQCQRRRKRRKETRDFNKGTFRPTSSQHGLRRTQRTNR